VPLNPVEAKPFAVSTLPDLRTQLVAPGKGRALIQADPELTNQPDSGRTPLPGPALSGGRFALPSSGARHGTLPCRQGPIIRAGRQGRQ
jgi:hypothetical protein